jgi:hypothetical protein
VDDSNNNQPPKQPEAESQKVVFLKSVRNEQKDRKQTTRQNKPKSASEKNLDERFYKLIEILEEHQERIRKLESNLLSLAKIIKIMREDFLEAAELAKKTPHPPPAAPPDEE